MTKISKSTSLSTKLSIRLIVITALVALISVTFLYFEELDGQEASIIEELEDSILFLEGALAIPLWDIDDDAVKALGETAMQNTLITQLSIENDKGRIIFSSSTNQSENVLLRSFSIFQGERLIGKIEIGADLAHFAEDNIQMLRNYLIVVSLIFIAIVIMTRLSVKILIGSQVDSLNEIVHTYASEVYNSSHLNIPYVEFEPFVEVLNQMGSRINVQIAALKNAKENYRGIFENSIVGIFRSTPDGEIVRVNQSMAEILGFLDADDMIKHVGNNLNQIYLDPNQRREIVEIISKEGHVENYSADMLDKNKNVIYVSLSARAINDSSGKFVFLEGVMSDISERIEAEKENKRLAEQLLQSQKIESIGRLAGGIAHDFNNILTGILGYSEMLLLKLKDPADLKAVKSIYKGSERAAGLTKQLLGFARGGKYNPVPIDVNLEIEETLKISEKIFDKKINIKLELNYNVSSIIADKGQINQILTNLIFNARDAMPDGGDLIIKTDEEYFDEEQIKYYQQFQIGNYVSIEISDTGCGIPEEIHDMIFEPFFTTKESGKGTGLGLATVYGIVKNHEGNINFYSEPGEGTTFNLYFRASERKVDLAIAKSDITKGFGKILVVDDEETVRELVCEMLDSLGYSTYQAENGSEGVELYKENQGDIDLVLMDIIMPVMDGKKAVKKILEINSDAKILISSGYSKERRSDDLSSLGVKGFLQKPFRRGELAEAISSQLKQI